MGERWIILRLMASKNNPKKQMKTTYPLKVQASRSQGQQPRLYVSFPLALAAAIGLEPGETVQWELLDRGELHLVRPTVPPTTTKRRAAKPLPAARYNGPFLPQTGIFNPFAPVENQEQFDGSRAVYRRDWAYPSRWPSRGTNVRCCGTTCFVHHLTSPEALQAAQMGAWPPEDSSPRQVGGKPL